MPALLPSMVFVLAGGWLGWVGATVAGGFAAASWSTWRVWRRRTPPVVGDANGIDLQGSGPVP